MSDEVKKDTLFWDAFWPESRKLMALALPMILGQVGQLLLSVCDTIMVGRVGVEPLAGVAFGGSVMLFFFIIAMGLCSAVHVLVAQASGPNKYGEASNVLKHGVWLVLIYAIPLGLITQFGVVLLDYFGQPEEVLVHARPYAIYMAWSILPGLVYRSVRNYYEGFHQPWWPFWITIGAILVNVFLNWVLIFGHLGAPAMGAAGAGLATLIARCMGVTTIVTVLFLRHKERFDVHFSVPEFFRLRWEMLVRMLRIGFPTMLQIGCEFGFVTVAMVMVGWIGSVELATQQVVTNYTALIFMVPLGLAFAITIRVATAVGARSVCSIRNIGYGGVVLGGAFMGVFGVITYFFRDLIPTLFIEDMVVVGLSAQVLLFVAGYQFWDGVQVTAMAALRGVPDMRIPLKIVVVCYWLVGTPLMYLLAFKLDMGLQGIWTGLIVGVALASCFLVWRFERVSKCCLKPQGQCQE